MVVALKPLHDAAKIKRVVVSTYQSVSGGGKAAMDELFNQTRHFYMNDAANPEIFPKQISFNVIPQIDKFLEDEGDMTKEEWKMVVETNKIMGGNINVCANCVRVPVFIGHSEMVNVEFENPLSAKEAQKLWSKAPGVTLIDLDSDLGYVTPAEIAGEDDVFISRVRPDKTVPNGLNFWCVSDNLRKGAALNAVQIAEVLIQKHMKAAA
jgi:aspartate-semialdehyde dehydrogenase